MFLRGNASVILLFSLVVAATHAGAEPYVVNGLKLGDPIQRNSASYRAHQCSPSEHSPSLKGYAWCRQTQQRATSQGRTSVTNTIIHAKNGTAVYLMAKASPLQLSRSAVNMEIENLTKEIKEPPSKIEWFPSRSGVPTSVVAAWGRVELRKLDGPDVDTLREGQELTRNFGVLVDPLGDVTTSAQAGLPIYRIGGAAGHVYFASFDETGKGHHHYIAADASYAATRRFEPRLNEVLRKDQTLAPNDYSLWPAVAELTRNLSLETSPLVANATLDKVFSAYVSKKLHSHVWSLLPLSSLDYLKANAHSTNEIYGPGTQYAEIRRSIEEFLADNPAEPFREFLYYVIGDFDKALSANPQSIIKGPVRYALGFRKLEQLLEEVSKVVTLSADEENVDPQSYPGVDTKLKALNAPPHREKRLGDSLPNFKADSDTAVKWFQELIDVDQLSPHRDDASYMMAWLSFHQGNFDRSLRYLEQTVRDGNGDYRRPAATRLAVRMMKPMSAHEQLNVIKSHAAFAQQPALWYLAARSAYRAFDYGLAIDAATRGLKELGIQPDRLPATTDPEKIGDALRKLKKDSGEDENLQELPYLLEASKELQRYEKYLSTAAADRPNNLFVKARTIIFKFSRLLESPTDTGRRNKRPELSHKDLRQALHLIDMTLARVPRDIQYGKLRDWLHYRKIRILAAFDPTQVPAAVAGMEAEFPGSQLLDDAMSEKLLAEGMMRDVDAAKATFDKVLMNHPRGNALDNAHTWMAIIFRCAGKLEDAQRINREIIRRFPVTRHAVYAVERLATPDASACGLVDVREVERP